MNELLQEGRYRIIRQIGENGTGFIYEGFDNIFDKKIFINHCAYNGRKNLSEEEKILKGIKHEVFLRVTDYFAEPNGWFVMMEAEDGEFLSDVITKEASSPDFSAVMSRADQLLDALGYLHLHLPPIIYGDLKPQNIILAPGGKVKLITAAILKSRSANKTAETPSSEALIYSPLEQLWDGLDSASQKVIVSSYDENAEKILRQPADARSDIYSLSVLIYQMLTKQFPKNALERSIEILEGNPDPLISPNRLNSEIPSEIGEILQKALEIRRENRFDSAVIMRQVLRTAFVSIRERENQIKTEHNQPSRAPAAQIPVEQEIFELDELFELDQLPKAEKISQKQETEKIEEENPLTVAEEIDLIETPASLNLPRAENTSAPLRENLQKESAAEEQAVEAEETLAETPVSEKNIKEKIEKNPAAIFDLNKSDREETLEAEKSPEILSAAVSSAAGAEPAAEAISAKDSVKVAPEIVRTDYKKDYSPGEHSVLFENAEEKKRSKWSVPVVALILVLVGSGAFGAWMFASKSGSNATNQTVSDQTDVKQPLNPDSPAEDPAQAYTGSQTPANPENAESQTLSTLETNSETDSGTNPVLAQETAPSAKKPAAVKPKPAAAKPQTASAKTPEKQPKKITVDDLISDY